MQKPRLVWFWFLLSVVVMVSIACQSAAPAATPTSTPLPPTVPPTATVKPTSTPRPTSTPNVAATQQYQAREDLLQSYVDKGYIPSKAGEFEEIDDFHEQWAQLGWYQYYPLHEKPATYGDLMFHGHFGWESAIQTNDISGCGVLFGLQPNSDHYLVWIDKSRIAFGMSRGGNLYEVGKTSGSGRLHFTEPAEADVDIIIQGKTVYVAVNGDVTKYTLSADQSSSGDFALSLSSGTNKDFGTRCDITEAYLWLPEK